MIDKDPVQRDYLSLDKMPEGWMKVYEYAGSKRSELKGILTEERIEDKPGRLAVDLDGSLRTILKAMRKELQFLSPRDYFAFRDGRSIVYSREMLDSAYERILRKRFPQRYK